MTKEQLINKLKNRGILCSPDIIDAFEKIDRADFVRGSFKNESYGDYPLPIGWGQTISQPTTVAFMLELLNPQKGEKILDLGSGSGWTTALLGNLVTKSGQVIGVEKIPQLVEFGQSNLAKYPGLPAKIVRAGKKLGLPAMAPFDKILVSAAAEDLPKELTDQLKTGGVMVIPIGNSIFKIAKTAKNNFIKEEFPGFVFVPLLQD